VYHVTTTPAVSTGSRIRATAGLELLRLRTVPPVPDVTVEPMVIEQGRSRLERYRSWLWW
jgi:hypothetical protein